MMGMLFFLVREKSNGVTIGTLGARARCMTGFGGVASGVVATGTDVNVDADGVREKVCKHQLVNYYILVTNIEERHTMSTVDGKKPFDIGLPRT
jgi:hypothetical protein